MRFSEIIMYPSGGFTNRIEAMTKTSRKSGKRRGIGNIGNSVTEGLCGPRWSAIDRAFFLTGPPQSGHLVPGRESGLLAILDGEQC
jgi:hypothetical protein